jgi:type VI secretion system secreted protein VgrG
MSNLYDAGSALQAAADHQTRRLMRLRFPRDDAPAAMMAVNAFRGRESMSRDFEFVVEILCDNARIALKDVVGRMVTVELVREDGTLRCFNGYVFEFRFVRTDGGLARYEMVLRPWLAFLHLRRDNHLFHGKTIREQSESIFDDYDGRDWRWEVASGDPAMTDACQFDESDHNYLHRRWESRGWCYWYEHRADGHTLVLSDDTRRCPPIDGGDGSLPWRSGAGSREADGVADLTARRRLSSTQATATSFDFKRPRPLTADVRTVNRQGDVPDLEIHEYAGAYGLRNGADADAHVRRRMEEIEAAAKQFEARGNARTVMPGRWFRLSGHFDDDGGGADNELLILEAEHDIRNNYEFGRGAAAEYRNRFTCLRRQIPWRPGRGYQSVEPRIFGLQTAIVVGPSGEEIHTDEYGRVRVQFHWDREGRYDENSSAWVRVASAWTGNGYGIVAVPRVGQEVVVQFLDGCPDRPLVTACLFNQDNMPPWGMPGAAHRTGIRSRSTPGGGGHCEMVIHDRAGEELINIHSQRDMTTTVLHDQSTVVHNNQSTVVHGPWRSIAVTEGAQDTTVRREIRVCSQESSIQVLARGAVEVTSETGHVRIEASSEIVLQVGQSRLVMDREGGIRLEGAHVTVVGRDRIDLNP